MITATVTATDYLGTYTKYTYSDGHIETDPPGRPMSREDVQRQRLAVLRSNNPSLAVPALAAGGNAVAMGLVAKPLQDTLGAMGSLALTVRAPDDAAAVNQTTFDVGSY